MTNSKVRSPVMALVAGALALTIPAAARAEQLYNGSSWAGVAADNKASAVGDLVMIVIHESASATNRVGTRSGKNTSLGGGLSVGGIDEDATLGFDSSYRGIGETERSDKFAASITALVTEVLPSGDLVIEGQHNLLVNGEKREIRLRGIVRAIDITPENLVLSSRLANATIEYDGKGYASRGAKPGLINRIFSFLGIG